MTSFNVWLLCLVGVAALLVGYAWGRRTGVRQGKREASCRTPLELRHRALVEGHCPICDEDVEPGARMSEVKSAMLQ